MRAGVLRSIGCAWVLIGAVGTANVALADAPLRAVEVRITDHAPGIADFKSLNVQLEGISIHRKRSARREGWVNLVGRSDAIDIVPLKDGRYVSIGTTMLPAGRYDALRIRFATLGGELHSGKPPDLSADDATVAIKVDLRENDHTPIVVDLYAESQTDHAPERYVVKVKDVRIGG